MKDRPFDRLPRVLVIDDNPAIHNDFRKILAAAPRDTRFESLDQRLFGGAATEVKRAAFRVDGASQGQAGLELVQQAREQDDPYAVAFVDVRMPPGWDGLETIERLWQCCPNLQTVICTAYSDYSWEEITRRLPQTDDFLILKKPFDTAEVLQIAHALAKKWELAQQARLRLEDLDRLVQERTRELRQEVEQRARVQAALLVSEERFSKAFHSS